jgi:hypothetical protein
MITSKRMRWTGHVAWMGKRNAYMLLVGKPEDNMPLGKPSHRRVNNKMDLGEIGRDGTDWIGLAQDMDQWRVKKNYMVKNLRVP